MSTGGKVEGTAVRRRLIDFGMDQFGHDVRWSAISEVAAERMGRSAGGGFPGWFRVWMLAVARMEKCGHASFAYGELVTLFGVDSNGVITDTKPENVAKGVDRAIREAVAKGLLTTQSGRRCLVLPGADVQRGTGRSTCPQHGTRV